MVLWLVAVVAVRNAAPPWDSVTHDGDFAYLPANMPSVVGEQWMTEAFPRQRGRSQVVVAIVRRESAVDQRRYPVAYDVARRMKNLFGARRLAEARELAKQHAVANACQRQTVEAADVHTQFLRASQQAGEALEEALELDERLADYWGERIEQDPAAAAVTTSAPGAISITTARCWTSCWVMNRRPPNTAPSPFNLTLRWPGCGDQVLPDGAASCRWSMCGPGGRVILATS